ncbi:MAG: acyltransferase [SAR86 cluster bacterium]|nr:acyltransferase [SAR86 cluster bacterium]
MDYRKEIDGLRALAILPVVMFHSGLPFFSWGYIGVDIFFVISGFLITSIIFPKIEKNEFSFLWFYENRARRLFPALFLMIFLSALTALFLFEPIKLKEFSYSIFSSIFFYSNFFFWQAIDYFESNAESMPFLHTWSLSIEEQFYIFFPIFLIVIVKTISRHLLPIIFFFTVLSLALWVYGNIFFQTATFYLPITRAWELMAGAFLAIYIHKNGFLKYKILSTLGLLILFLSFYFFSVENKLKNLFMVLPVIGTLMILSVKSHYSFVNALLMNKVSIFFGLISYSLYLFHQPIFAFAKIYYIDLEPYQIIFFTILSILMSIISWKYFEQIFRVRYKSQLSFSKTALVLSMPFLLSISIAIYSIQTDGNRSNYFANLNYEELRTLNLLEEIKQENEKDIFIDNSECIFSKNDFSIEFKERILECAKTFGKGVLFFGDSHAKDIFNSYQYLENKKFIVGIAANFCQGHITVNNCYFQELSDFLKLYPEIFKKIYFHQAGYFFLSQDGKKLDNKYSLERLALNDESSSFRVEIERVKKLKENLKIFPKTLVVIGPRIEPHIQNKYIKKFFCSHEFKARDNLSLAFKSLDQYFEDTFPPENYISLQKVTNFLMSEDFINCNEIFWSDGDHWSISGEKKFSYLLRNL